MSFCPCIRTWFSICQVHRSFVPPTQAWPLRVLWLSGSFATQTQKGSKNLTTSPLLPAGPHPISYGAPPDLPVLSWASAQILALVLENLEIFHGTLIRRSCEELFRCQVSLLPLVPAMPAIPKMGVVVSRHDFIDSLQNNMLKFCQKLFNWWN